MSTPYHFALIGTDVAYSRSTDVFRAIFDHLHIDGEFETHSVSVAELESRVRQLVLDGVRGFAVTIPHKRNIIAYMDDIDPVARALGAVNSISVDGHRLYGYNTDCYGFTLPLRRCRERMLGKPALILGNGGAARAVAYALWKDFNVRRFVLAGRSLPRLEEFRADMAQALHNASIELLGLPVLSTATAGSFGIAVNCTPLGGPNFVELAPLPDGFDFRSLGVYYDLNYNRPSRTIERARESGVEVVDGASMLVGQAVRSFDIWTGRTVEYQPIFDAVFGAH
jgi:shikimate dehydrogenase